MNLYIFSHPDTFYNEPTIITQLLEQVDCVFHIRKPGFSKKEYNNYLELIPAHLHAKIMLHGAYELHKEYKLKGLHFSIANRTLAKKFSNCGLKSTGCHSIDELKTCDTGFDYLFISPVFDSISKPGYKGSLNMEQLQYYLKTQHTAKIIALGGIEASTLPCLSEFSFDGCAVLGAVWTKQPNVKTDVVTNAKNLLKWMPTAPIV